MLVRGSGNKTKMFLSALIVARSSQSLLDGSVATCGVCICIASFHNILDIASILASNVFMCIHVKFLHVCLV